MHLFSSRHKCMEIFVAIVWYKRSNKQQVFCIVRLFLFYLNWNCSDVREKFSPDWNGKAIMAVKLTHVLITWDSMRGAKTGNDTPSMPPSILVLQKKDVEDVKHWSCPERETGSEKLRKHLCCKLVLWCVAVDC